MEMSESDSVLVGRARRGDTRAFDALVSRHLGAAYAVALARVGEPSDAEDVCQDAFISALQRLDECRQPDRFGAWLLGIVRNRATDHHRYRAVRATLPLESAAQAPDRASPERDLARGVLHEDLLEALESLTVLQREVILLYDLEGWSHREVAEKLGISEGSARVHLHNGRKTLRALLSERYREDA
jgi:RNA polymerase sigma-70 factor (ECF subfamily)